MKKKIFKRAGVAVLSMAMLLSMGAIGGLSASAAPSTDTYSVTIVGGQTSSYSYSKIADLDEDLVHYTIVAAWGTAGFEVDSSNYIKYKTGQTPAVTNKMKFSEYTAAADKQELALDLAAKTGVSWTAVTSDTVTGLTPGYYVFKSANAQPILVEVKNANITNLKAKATSVTIDKAIASIVATNSTEAAANLKNSDGSKGLVEAGATVNYNLTTKFPVYDTAALIDNTTTPTKYKNITDFTITDIPEDTLTINKGTDFAGVVVKKKSTTDADWVTLTKGTDYTIVDASDAVISATDKESNEKYFHTDNATNDTTTANGGFKITFTDGTVLENVGADVKVEFNATVSATPDTNNDKNRNSTVVEYNNNYFTGGYDKDNPTTPEDPNKHDDDNADVFCTVVTVNKKDQDGTALPGATFALYKGTDTTASGTVVKTIGSRNSGDAGYGSSFSFTGLDIGTYTLHEVQTPSDEYVAAADITFTITESGWTGNFTFTNSDNVTTYTNGVIDVTNTKGQTPPGTGGMGTILFTVGGAAIVLLAGAMFVLYMKKRRVEE